MYKSAKCELNSGKSKTTNVSLLRKVKNRTFKLLELLEEVYHYLNTRTEKLNGLCN